ncbi:MAG: hypothetical protein AseanaTS_17320 [Candidatus Pelagadaptatus aseana]|uniref:hypothetical protein n=1 Tax=Candidatus Pelagadaptatus aseana TaxID=3120508 RepID=UPI0039B248DE
MDILYIIRSEPGSGAFNEAVTALLGCSLFGQKVGYILTGMAGRCVSDQSSPLSQVVLMELAQGYLHSPQRAPSACVWSEAIRPISDGELQDLISEARHVFSF